MLEQGFSRTFVNVSGEQSHRWSAGCKSKAFQQIHGQRTAQRLRHKAFQTQVMTTPCPPEPTLGKAAHRLTAPKCARQAPASVLMATGTFPLQPIPAPGCPASAASQLRLADDKRPRIQARRPLSVPLPALPPSLQNSFLRAFLQTPLLEHRSQSHNNRPGSPTAEGMATETWASCSKTS
ncbi:uncharacterized protein LOC144303432 isoform X2 [Canis aureus]